MRRLIALAFLLAATPASAAEPPLPLSITPLTPDKRVEIETAFRRYVDCFNRKDIPCFTNYYNKDVVFVSASLPTMNGPDEIVRFYSDVWKHLSEHIVVRGFEYSGDRLIVEMENTLTVFADYPDFVVRPLKKGKYPSSGKVAYVVKDGRFSRIADGVD